MAMNMTVWRIRDGKLETLPKRKLDQEDRLERWLADDPSLIGLDVCIIGRQVTTGFGGRIDLLGIDSEGDLVIIELKRDKTPRDIVAQVLDYASWVDGLGHDDVDHIVQRYLKKSLGSVFSEYFDSPLPEAINGSCQLVIVAAELDDASERITEFLASRHGININVVFFNFMEQDGQEFLARSWLMDPQTVEKKTDPKKRAPWTGLWYVNIGEEHDRSWNDRRKYGFVSAGGGEKYSRPLSHLKAGDRLFAYIKGHGYVGFGEVTEEKCLASGLVPPEMDRPLTDLSLESSIPKDPPLDGKEEYAVGVRWLESVPRDQAKWFTGAFANQNVVCKLRDPATLEFLQREFRTTKHSTDGE
jgi:hypothetical protein